MILDINYRINRLKRAIFERKNPDKPWLGKNAVIALESLITKNDTILECGSGRSTIWFAKIAKHVISIEHHKGWFDNITSKLKAENLSNVNYNYVEYGFDGPQVNTDYTKTIDNLENSSIDICLIDGGPRSYCAKSAIPKLKSGGILIFDDAQAIFPSTTKVYDAIRRLDQIPSMWNNRTTLIWPEIYELTKNWRRINTTDGVTNTLFLIKP